MSLADSSVPFLNHLEGWLASLPALELEPLVREGASPDDIAVVSVDVIEGFCRLGPLASPRVEAIIPRVASLISRAHALGVERIALVQDTHPPDAEEFAAFGVHCVAGTPQAEAVRELRDLPGYEGFTKLPKNSISALESTGLQDWLASPGEPRTIVAVGDVTDLCLYSLALGLKLRSIARGLGQRVIVPADCAQTWDSPDHPGDLHHALFLNQLRRNGVEVVASLG